MDNKKFLDKVVDRLLKESMYRIWEDKNITYLSKKNLNKIRVDIKFALINTQTEEPIEVFDMETVKNSALRRRRRKKEYLEDYEEEHLTNIYGLNSEEREEVIFNYYNKLYNNIYKSYLEMNEDDKVPTNKPEEWIRGDEVFDIGGRLNESLSTNVNNIVDKVFKNNPKLTKGEVNSIFRKKYKMNQQDADQAMVIYLSKEQSLNESDRQGRYLDKVVERLVSETHIDVGDGSLYAPGNTNITKARGSQFVAKQAFNPQFPSYNILFSHILRHCRDIYGLTEQEINYVWNQYFDEIESNYNYLKSLNESIEDTLKEQHYEEWDERSRERNINLLKTKGIDILSTDINVPFYRRIDSKEIRFLKKIADRLDKESKIEVVGEGIDDEDFLLLTPFGKFEYFDFINEYRHRRFEKYVDDLYAVGDNQIMFPTHNSIAQTRESAFLWEMYKDKLKRKWYGLVNPGLDIPDDAIITEQDLSDEELKYLDSSFENMGTPSEIASEELGNLITWVKNLPEELFLYRLLYLDDVNNIDYDELGSHYSQDRTVLIDNHYSRGSIYGDMGEHAYLITVKVPKSEVDVMETLNNNILYPNEEEITLKNKGIGATYLDIEEI